MTYKGKEPYQENLSGGMVESMPIEGIDTSSGEYLSADDSEDMNSSFQEGIDRGEFSSLSDEGDELKPRELQEIYTQHWHNFLKMPTHYKGFIVFWIVLLISISYWGTHYNKTMRQIDTKEQELMDLRYRMLYTTAELVQLERINHIEERITEMQLPLEHSRQAPINVGKNND